MYKLETVETYITDCPVDVAVFVLYNYVEIIKVFCFNARNHFHFYQRLYIILDIILYFIQMV